MRTNIDIDDKLMREAMSAMGASTKKAAVEEALRRVVQLKRQGEALESLWGSVTWCGPDDDWFAPDPLDPSWQEDMDRRGIKRPVPAVLAIPEASLGNTTLTSDSELVGSHDSR